MVPAKAVKFYRGGCFSSQLVTHVFDLVQTNMYYVLYVALLLRYQEAYEYCRQWTIAKYQRITENDFSIRLVGGSLKTLGAEEYGGDGSYDNQTGPDLFFYLLLPCWCLFYYLDFAVGSHSSLK